MTKSCNTYIECDKHLLAYSQRMFAIHHCFIRMDLL